MFDRNTPGVYRLSSPADGFTLISHEFSRSRMPARAVKVGLYVLSHREGFTQTQEQIGAAIKMDPTTVRAALRDLETERFLIRHEIRDERGHRIGTAYGITDQRIPPTGESPGGKSPGGKSPGPKKTSSRSETTNPEKTNPSGGQTAVAAARSLEVHLPEQQEDEMPRRTDPASLALFDVPGSKTAEKAPESPSAKTVTAAYVDSYREHHSGGDPLKRDIGRVARDAKALLESGQADPGELTEAASAMGSGPYSNLGMALKIHRDGGRRRGNRQGGVPARPYTDPEWQRIAEENEQALYQRLLVDDEIVAWIARNQSEVDELCAKFPALVERFRDAA